MGNINISKAGFWENNPGKRLLASLSALTLALGLCLAGLLVTPMTAKADETHNPRLDQTTYYANSLGVGMEEVEIPCVLRVNNLTAGANGKEAYIPAFEFKYIAKPVISGKFLPSNFKTDHPSDGTKTWLEGELKAFLKNNPQQFGDTMAYTIENTSSGADYTTTVIYYDEDWFTSRSGVYRYQLFIYEYRADDEQESYPMFTVPDMDSPGNRIFLDFYVKNGAVTAVIVVDEDDHKLEAVGTAEDDKQKTTTIKPKVGGEHGGIYYNVVDVDISNTILGKNTNGFTYAGSATVDYSEPSFFPTKFNLGTQGDTVGTGEWSSNIYFNSHSLALNYSPNQDTKGFNYTIKNFPLGWTLNMAQSTQVDVEGKIQVYERDTSRWTNYSTDPLEWINTLATANGYDRIKNQTKTITSVTVDHNKIGFVNAILESTPETGIALQVLPFIIMAAGAGIILLFFMRRRRLNI